MSVTESLVKNRHSVWAAVIGVTLFGVMAYFSIPVRLFPDTAPPLVNVVTPWRGAAAADVATDLSRILDEEFASLEGVVNVKATSQDNLSLITVEFGYEEDVRLAAVDVQNAISGVSDRLPPGISTPRVLTFSTADRPVYTLGVIAKDPIEARRLAEDVIGPRLQRVEGVAAVDVFGGRVPAVLIDVDPKALEAHALPLERVAQQISSSNVSVPAGRLRGTQTETMLRVDQRVNNVEALEDVVLPTPTGPLRLGNVATVTRGALDDDSWFSINGERGIAVQVFRAEDANTVAVVARVVEAVEALRTEYPNLKLVAGEESASFTQRSVDNLLSNVWQALILAALILFLFFGRIGSSMVTLVSMPLAYGLAFGVMYLLGMEFNLITLSAVILAMGMVVDASVVVLENIVRLRDEEGLGPFEAAIRGSKEVSLPVIAGALTTLIVLIPLMGLGGFIGKIFGPLAGTLALALMSSLVVALLVVPVLTTYLGDGRGRIDRVASVLVRPYQLLMDGVRAIYLAMLRFGLRHVWVVMLVAVISLVGGVAGMRKAGMDVLPKMDSGTFSISLETPSGTSLAQTAALVNAIQDFLSAQPEVLLVQAQAGYEAGMKFSGGSGVMGPTQGYLSVTLSARTERVASIWEIEHRTRAHLDKLPGIANFIVKEMGNTAKASTLAPLVGRLSGPDPRVLDVLGEEVRARLATVESVVKPTRSWRRDLSRVVIDVDPLLAADKGQSVLSVAQGLLRGAEGIPAGTYTEGFGTPEPVRVRYARAASPRVEDVLDWPMFIPGASAPVPVRTIATARRVVEQGLFTREQLVPTLDILAELNGRPLSFVVADAKAALEGMVVPQGYKVSIEGENNDLETSKGELIGALLLGVLAVYLLLVAQFRSFLHPLTIMLAVPLSLSGVATGLHIVGKPISMPVMVGLVLLVGMVVNNSIMLVDIIQRNVANGMERHEAIISGVRTRFRPIMMTTLSTIVGMIPLALEWALGAERLSPLAVAVIGGMTASTMLTMVVIPVFYDVAERMRSRLRRAAPVVATAALSLLVLSVPTRGVEAAPVSLEGAWTQMQQTNPALAVADAKRAEATAAGMTAAGYARPELGVTVRYSRMSAVDPMVLPVPSPTGEPLTLGEPSENHYSLRATVTQPIYAGGALTSGREAAASGLRGAEAGREAVEARLWLSLVEGWYGYALASESVVVQRQLLVVSEAQVARLDRLKAQQRATELEVLSVAVKRAEAAQALASAEASVLLAKTQLEVLVGGPVDPEPMALLPAARKAAAPIMDGDSPSRRAATAQVDVAKAQMQIAEAAFMPTVAFKAGAQYENPNMRHFPAVPEWKTSWDASVVASWSFDFGVRKGKAASAEAHLRGMRAQVKAVDDAEAMQVAQAKTALVVGTRNLKLAAERARLGERAVKAAETAVKAGRTTSVTLLERAADLAKARLAERMSAHTVLVAVQRLRAVKGERGPQ